ncbi:Meprin A subunit beta [Branchiostoma belcheri]|nr:Meprin A subunit beta [Branchiostoma belcheri]
MVLEPEQVVVVQEMMKNGTSPEGDFPRLGSEPAFKRPKRKAIRDLRLRWPGGTIPYIMGDSLTHNDRYYIDQAMAKWHEHSCVRFKPYSRKMASYLGHHDHIIFYKGSGLMTGDGRRPMRHLTREGSNFNLTRLPEADGKNVGRLLERDQQVVSINDACLFATSNPVGVIMHELGHVMGLYHEHSRPDRDEFVDILVNNVRGWWEHSDSNVSRPGEEYNFQKMSSSDINLYNIPYDYMSIMHYYNSRAILTGAVLRTTARCRCCSVKDEVPNEWTVRADLQTIVTKDTKYQYSIGHKHALSFYDIKTVNLLYGCGDLSTNKLCYATNAKDRIDKIHFHLSKVVSSSLPKGGMAGFEVGTSRFRAERSAV